MDILLNDIGKIVRFYIDTLELSKNCTYSENAILVFIESLVADNIINEVITFYENSQLITENEDNKSIFLHSNGVFSNLCRSKKGFEWLFNKIGLAKFINIAKVTDNLDILTAVMQLLVNYFENDGNKEEVAPLYDDIFTVIKKCLNFEGRTARLITYNYLLSGLIYSIDVMERMIPISNSLFN